MDVIWHHMACKNFTPALSHQCVQHRLQKLSHCAIEFFLMPIRHKHNVIFAVPFRMYHTYEYRERTPGKASGRRDVMLRRLLTRRFGPLPDEVEQRLHAATVQELERWADRVLDAQRLDEVFRDV